MSKHTMDEKLKGKLGYYLKKSDFIYFSFDDTTGEYWIQYGYIRPSGEAFERQNSCRRVMKSATLERQIEKWSGQGYVLTEKPKDMKLRDFAKLRNDYKEAGGAIEETKEPEVELQEGFVRVGKTALEVKKGEFDYVPKLNEAYFFAEHTNDVVMDMLEVRPVLLTGHTGCGKTSLVEQIAARINQPTIRSNMNGQTTVGDFVGMWTVKAGETVWVDGVLPRAMKEGHWLVIDEIDCADAQILAVLNAVLEKNGTLTLKEKGFEVVRPHKDFRLFATANTVGCMSVFRSLYQGTNLMNEAFLDRFRVYHVDYLPQAEEVKVLVASVPKIRPEVASAMVNIANLVRESFRKEDMSCTFSTRRLIDWAEMYLRHGNLKKSAQNIIYSKISQEDAKTIDGLITRYGNI